MPEPLPLDDPDELAWLMAFTRKMVGRNGVPRGRREDAAQDVYVAVLQCQRRYNHRKASWRTYVYRRVLGAVQDHCREHGGMKMGRRQDAKRESVDSLDVLTRLSGRAIRDRRNAAQLAAAFEAAFPYGVPRELQRWIEGDRVEEIAKDERISAAGVWLRLRNAADHAGLMSGRRANARLNHPDGLKRRRKPVVPDPRPQTLDPVVAPRSNA